VTAHLPRGFPRTGERPNREPPKAITSTWGDGERESPFGNLDWRNRRATMAGWLSR